MSTARLLCASSGESISQIYTGFALLAEQGAIDVELHKDADYAPGLGGTIVRCELDGSRIVYDTQDHATFPEDLLGWATHYFKRSFDIEEVRRSGRADIIRPLGLNYPVYARSDWRYRRIAWSLAGLRPSNGREVLTRIIRLSAGLSRLLGSDQGRSAASIHGFENLPSDAGESILLLTRTWDPRRVEGDRATMRAEVNRVRAESIRALRAEFGPRFVGGVAPTEDALRDHADVVVDPALTRKPAYLATMKRSAVCVTSRGLIDTNGWRLAEYVAASRAIVSEPLVHAVPGGFAPGRNYLAFQDTASLIESVQALVDDDERRSQMRYENFAYYRSCTRPDALIQRTLDIVRGRELPAG